MVVQTIGAGAGLLQNALLGLLDYQGLEASIVHQRTAARRVPVLLTTTPQSISISSSSLLLYVNYYSTSFISII